jgi:hypothetical protein
VFAAYDVVDLMWQIRVVFMKQAIFAWVGGAFRDESP